MVGVDFAFVSRFDPDAEATLVGAWAKTGDFTIPVGTRLEMGGDNVHARILQTRQPVRIDGYSHASGAAGELARSRGFDSGIGVPIEVAGRLWGVMGVAATRIDAYPPHTMARLAGFTELVGTAVANAEAQAQLATSLAELHRLAEEQSALRRPLGG